MSRPRVSMLMCFVQHFTLAGRSSTSTLSYVERTDGDTPSKPGRYFTKQSSTPATQKQASWRGRSLPKLHSFHQVSCYPLLESSPFPQTSENTIDKVSRGFRWDLLTAMSLVSLTFGRSWQVLNRDSVILWSFGFTRSDRGECSSWILGATYTELTFQNTCFYSSLLELPTLWGTWSNLHLRKALIYLFFVLGTESTRIWMRTYEYMCTKKVTSHSYMEPKRQVFTQLRAFSSNAWKTLETNILLPIPPKLKCFSYRTVCAKWQTSYKAHTPVACVHWRPS